MNNVENKLTDVFTEVQLFLKAKARNDPYNNIQIILKTAYRYSLVFTDQSNKNFSVDQTYLSSFRDIYSDSAYKFVRFDDWEVEITFKGKKVLKIDVICSRASFLANKIETRHISGCYIKFPIIQSPKQMTKLTPQCLGYLNRIGKKKVCSESQNASKQIKSLVYFIPRAPRKFQPFEYNSWKNVEEYIDPLQALTPVGLYVLEKLGYFLTSDQIRNFMIQKEISKQACSELQRLIAARKAKRQQDN